MPGEGDPTSQILIKLGEMGAQLAVISEQIRANQTQVGDHEQRLRVLERARWPLPTVTSVAAGASAVAAWLAVVHR